MRSGRAAGTLYQLGTVVDNGGITPERAGWDTQRQLTVTVPQIGSAACDVMLRNEVAGTGPLVVFHGGTEGDVFFSSYANQNDMMVDLDADGYRVAQIRWTGADGWVNAPDGYKAGIGRMTARIATVYRYLHVTYGGGQKLILVGHSGGATVISYSLAHHRLDNIVSRAVMVSGPVMVDLWKSCAGAAGDEAHRLQWSEAQQDGTATLPDLADGYVPSGTSPCCLGGTTNPNGEQWRQSGLFKATHWTWPNTDVRFHRHLLDNTQVIPDQQLLRDWLTARSRPFTVTEVANTDHNPNTPESADAIYASVIAA